MSVFDRKEFPYILVADPKEQVADFIHGSQMPDRLSDEFVLHPDLQHGIQGRAALHRRMRKGFLIYPFFFLKYRYSIFLVESFYITS